MVSTLLCLSCLHCLCLLFAWVLVHLFLCLSVYVSVFAYIGNLEMISVKLIIVNGFWQVVFATPGMLHAGLSLAIFKKWAGDERNMVNHYSICSSNNSVQEYYICRSLYQAIV